MSKLRVRDALDRLAYWPENHYLAWRGQSFVYTSDGYRWEDMPAPQGGEVADMADMRHTPDPDLATHWEVLGTNWGDYSGSDYNRSNCRSILRDYPEIFIEVRGGFNSSYLALALDAEVDEHVIDELASLLDYPVWDEGDHAELLAQIEQESWDSWGASDLRREVLRLAGCDEERVDEWLDRTDFTDLAWSEEVREQEAIWSLYFVAETAVSGYWEGFVDWAQAILNVVIPALNREDAPAEWQPVPQCDGQLTLA